MKSLNEVLILIVDDDIISRTVLCEALSQDYQLITANNGKQALQQIDIHKDDLIIVLLDVNLPDISGIEVLRRAHQQNLTQKIIFMLMSSDAEDPVKIKCLEYGAVDFLTKPLGAEFIQKRVERALNEYNKQQAFYNILIDQIAQRDTRAALLIYILAQILKQNNNESGEHVIRIRIITRIILEALLKVSDKYTLSAEDISAMSLAACLHDIGKVRVSNAILNKPAKLTPEEFEEVKLHTIYGDEMLNEYTAFGTDSLLKFAREICRWHHERWDGKGYPDGLSGDEIPIWAQAVAISDCYDALTSDRCYKKAYSHDEAIKMILDGECGVFNPDVIKALLIAADKIKDKLSALSIKNSVELDTKQEARRFADTVLTHYKRYLN